MDKVTGERVVILGASNNPTRFSNKALKMLKNFGHLPLPVHPQLSQIEGEKVFSTLNEISGQVDTLTMYVGPKISSAMKEDILKLKARRVIFNPGSENPELEKALRDEAGAEVVEACTLVMLQSGQF